MSAGRPGAERAAFFDVDETLLAVRGMEDFWSHWSGTPYGRGRDRRFAEVVAMVRAGVAREECNRAYYRLFAGVGTACFEHACRQWYGELRTRPDAAVAPVLRALRAHRRRGDLVVLVSGSASGLLAPLALDVGADVVLATEQLAERGVLTGEVRRPMVGAAKAEGVVRTLEARGLPASSCHAYGDHASDLAMLSLVGHPRVVGADPLLGLHARARGWPVLPSAPGPLRSSALVPHGRARRPSDPSYAHLGTPVPGA
ncbi:HAD-IB family hydrolase [Streptomyces sp. NPDC048109]|uniref:HAD family hydrolase n=1 Tax=unclassified Streptomyces TaxID=2593676 RepID=UPI0033FE1381